MNIFYSFFILVITIQFIYTKNLENKEECNPINILIKKDLSNNCCSEEKITCKDGHVTEINLRFFNLTGPIPSEIGNLNHLKIIDLSYNYNLNGTIPPELGKLSNLEYLNIRANSFSGTIPPELGNLSNLKYLELDRNNFSGTIPPELGKLSNLEYLGLGNNDFSGTIPPELGNLSNLSDFELRSSGLKGPIPPELKKLSEKCDFHLDASLCESTEKDVKKSLKICGYGEPSDLNYRVVLFIGSLIFYIALIIYFIYYCWRNKNKKKGTMFYVLLISVTILTLLFVGFIILIGWIASIASGD